MLCGWRCGARLTASWMRAQFTECRGRSAAGVAVHGPPGTRCARALYKMPESTGSLTLSELLGPTRTELKSQASTPAGAANTVRGRRCGSRCAGMRTHFTECSWRSGAWLVCDPPLAKEREAYPIPRPRRGRNQERESNWAPAGAADYANRRGWNSKPSVATHRGDELRAAGAAAPAVPGRFRPRGTPRGTQSRVHPCGRINLAWPVPAQ
jgi:hypothetical protein